MRRMSAQVGRTGARAMQQASVRSSRPSMGYGLVLGLLLLGAAPEPVFAQCPDPPLVTIAPQPPSDVCIPTGFFGNPIAFFDDFSWRSFIAMVWPVQPGMRGVPDTSGSIDPVSGPLVFETLKATGRCSSPAQMEPAFRQLPLLGTA